MQELPDSKLGMEKENYRLGPLWTTISEVFHACYKLIHCGKKGCTRYCKCVKAALNCTTLCFWRQLPDGSGDGRRKKNKSGEDGSYRTAKVSHGDRRRKKGKTKEDGSYHSAEVSP